MVTFDFKGVTSNRLLQDNCTGSTKDFKRQTEKERCRRKRERDKERERERQREIEMREKEKRKRGRKSRKREKVEEKIIIIFFCLICEVGISAVEVWQGHKHRQYPLVLTIFWNLNVFRFFPSVISIWSVCQFPKKGMTYLATGRIMKSSR